MGRGWGIRRSLRRALPIVLTGLLVTGAAVAAPPPSEQLVNRSFDDAGGSLAGWSGVKAQLSLAADGVAGVAAHVANRKSAATFGIEPAAVPVAPTTAGQTYTASGWVRGAGQLCLKLIERDSAGAQAGTRQACVAGSVGGWVQIRPKGYVLRAGGGSVTVRVFRRGAAVGDAFDLDELSLTGPTADTTAPEPPGGLSAEAAGPDAVQLSWSAASDDVGVASYRIFRDGVEALSVPGTQTSADDTGLSPATGYAYTVRAVDGAGNVSEPSTEVQATTDAAGPQAPVVAAAGDIACDPASSAFLGGTGTATACRQASTASLIEAMQPDAVLALGDLQYDCGGAAAFDASFDASWGAFADAIRPAVGNHEYARKGTDCDPAGGAAAYWDEFGAAAGTAGQGWYSFDLGSWHLVSLNSNCGKVACAPGSPQAVWLANDLASHPSQCTLAYWHHPRFSSGGEHGGNLAFTETFWSILQAAGADVVLNGHDHDYERFLPQMPDGSPAADGITEFVVGTGGRSHYPFGPMTAPNSAIRDSTTFGVLRLTLDDGGYSWQFVPEAPGGFTDSGSASCH